MVDIIVIMLCFILFFSFIYWLETSPFEAPVKKIHYNKIIDKLVYYEFHKNALLHSELPTIIKLKYSIFFTYYIKDTGLVFRFGKLSNEIKKRFKELTPAEEQSKNEIYKFYE